MSFSNETRLQTNLGQKTLTGIFWSYLSFLGGKGLSFLSTLILARLLLPEQFGLVGYCLIAIQYLDILNSAGIDSALIARRENLEEAANAAFLANVLLGTVCFALAWICAPAVAVFFKDDSIIPILRVLGLSLPLSGIGMVPSTLLQRQMRFRTKLLPDVSRNLTKGVISITFAAFGLGVWSLVWGQIAGIFVGTVLAWILAGWKPTWRFNADATRAITVYGFHIVMLEVIGVFRNNVDYMLVGRILGAAALGYYTMSFRIPELLIRSVNHAIGGVSLPALASMQANPGRLRSFYFSYLRYLSMFTFPVGVGLALTAPLFIPLFLSDTWGPAIVPTMLISLALGISALGFVPGVLYKAVNRPEVLNQLAIVKIPVAVFIFWYSTRWGIVGVAAGQIALNLISVSIDTLIANYIMKFSLKELLNTISATFFSTLAMGFVLYVVRQSISFDGLLALIVMIGVGVLVYFAMLWLISRDTLIYGVDMFHKVFFKSRFTKSTPVEIVSNE